MQQIMDKALQDQLMEYRNKVGTDFGDFRFEPGTGNWFFDGKDDTLL